VKRSVLRRPWYLYDINVVNPAERTYPIPPNEDTLLVSVNLNHRSITSYLEGWSPFNRFVLPNASSAAGDFGFAPNYYGDLEVLDGYKFWNPDSLGGWAMVSGDT